MSDLILSSLYRDRSGGFDLPAFSASVLAKLQEARSEFHSLHGGDFIGIEYEIENCDFVNEAPPAQQRIFNHYWNTTEDGSLRNNGAEFISKPIKGVHVANALLSLRDMLSTTFPHHRATGRCGIHVHINALDLTVPQVFAWISTYMVFERQLFKYSGGRDKNLFCLPTWAWSGNLKGAIQCLGTQSENYQSRAIRTLQEQGLKYAGLNTIPIGEHGTLEFRQMGTITNFNKVSLWIDLLTQIKVHARKINSVNDLEAYWKRLGTLNTTSEYGAFMGEVFGIITPELFFDGYEKDMAEGVVAIKELEIIYLRAKAVPVRAERTQSGEFREILRRQAMMQDVQTLRDTLGNHGGLVTAGARRYTHNIDDLFGGNLPPAGALGDEFDIPLAPPPPPVETPLHILEAFADLQARYNTFTLAA